MPAIDRAYISHWYSPRLFARLRQELVDGAACLPGSYEQWCQGEASRAETLQREGWMVIRVETDVEALDAYRAAWLEEPDYGSWREWLAASTRGARRP